MTGGSSIAFTSSTIGFTYSTFYIFDSTFYLIYSTFLTYSTGFIYYFFTTFYSVFFIPYFFSIAEPFWICVEGIDGFFTTGLARGAYFGFIGAVMLTFFEGPGEANFMPVMWRPFIMI